MTICISIFVPFVLLSIIKDNKNFNLFLSLELIFSQLKIKFSYILIDAVAFNNFVISFSRFLAFEFSVFSKILKID
jgi:hypothetical protein